MITLKIDKDYLVSSSEIVHNFSKMLDKTKEAPLFITRNNYIEGVIMDIEEYEMLLEKIVYLEDQLEDSYIKEIVMERKESFNIEGSVDEGKVMRLFDEE